MRGRDILRGRMRRSLLLEENSKKEERRRISGIYDDVCVWWERGYGSTKDGFTSAPICMICI